jgi:hypothetical protein
LLWIPRIGAAAMAAALSLLLQPIHAQSSPDDLLSRFEHDPNPIHRAKLLPKLGDTEFAAVRKDVADGDVTAAVQVLQKYHDQARSCLDGLDAQNTDAEKHPSGFKELEFSLRETLRRLDNLMGSLTRDEQDQFSALHKDLDEMNKHVIHELFPRQPDGSLPAPAKPQSQEPAR